MSDTYYYKRGVDQTFHQAGHIFQPGNYKNEDLLFRVNEDNTTILPVVIHCVALGELIYESFIRKRTLLVRYQYQSEVIKVMLYVVQF